MNADFERVMQIVQASGAYEVRIARDDSDQMRIWNGRKSAFSAVGRLSPEYIVQDGVVPRGRLAQTLAEIQRMGLVERAQRDFSTRLTNRTRRTGRTNAGIPFTSAVPSKATRRLASYVSPPL